MNPSVVVGTVETKIKEVVQIAHVKLQPVHGCIQVYLKTMTNDVKILFRLENFIFIIIFKQVWEALLKHFSKRNVIVLLLPLNELFGLLNLISVHSLGLSFLIMKLFDFEVGQRIVLINIGKYLDSVLLHVCNVLFDQWLVDLPELHEVMLVNSVQ